MARLNLAIESDDDLPELSTILRPLGTNTFKAVETSSTKQHGSEPSPENILPKAEINVAVKVEDECKPSIEKHQPSKQRPLGPPLPTRVNSLSFPVIGNETKINKEEVSIRSSPRRKAKNQIDYRKFAPRLSEASFSSSESEDPFTDLSGFIVPDSASEDDALVSKSIKSRKSRNLGEHTKKSSKGALRSSLDDQENTGPIDLTSPKKEKRISRLVCPESPPRCKTPPRQSDRGGSCSDLDEPFSKLRFSPPRSKSPYKLKEGARPITPPSSPSKSKLQSPSKRNRVSPSPHRPSIDAFWSADVINDWNEQYSPKKTLKSPRKQRLFSVDEDEDELSPSESLRRSPKKSPAKRDKAAIARRKAFDDRKHDLAASFLVEVDVAVGNGQIAELAESTGGIKIIWSKKLSSTAGRANWRREAIRSRNADGTVAIATYRHHASIELAEKVIDDEDRLINVIAHEYCHLANFMISGIKDNPHGASFKNWAAKCTRAFKHRNINVTTKHTYEITYKYIWACSSETCGIEYKRHSKSIDPAKHSCGSCKAKLVQVQPVPRKGEGEGKRSEYQDFVKRGHERVRGENPGKGFGEIMAILGREFRESKKPSTAVKKSEKSTKIDSVNMGRVFDLDFMARKLDSLNLED